MLSKSLQLDVIMGVHNSESCFPTFLYINFSSCPRANVSHLWHEGPSRAQSCPILFQFLLNRFVQVCKLLPIFRVILRCFLAGEEVNSLQKKTLLGLLSLPKACKYFVLNTDNKGDTKVEDLEGDDMKE